MTSLNVASLNVYGTASKSKQACLQHDLKENRLDKMFATKTKLDSLQVFSQLLTGYEKVMSPCLAGEKGLVVLYHRSLSLQVSIVFEDAECRLVVLDRAYSGKSFSLVDNYILKGGQHKKISLKAWGLS